MFDGVYIKELVALSITSFFFIFYFLQDHLFSFSSISSPLFTAMTDQHTEAAERQPLIDPRDRYRRIPQSQDEENGHAAVNSHNATPQEQGGDESNRLAAIQALPWYRRPSIGWLLPFVFLAVLVMGISQAPQEQLIIQIICKEHFKEREPRSEGGVMMTALLGPNGVPEDPCGTQEVLGLAAVVLGRVRALKYTSGTSRIKKGEGGVILLSKLFKDARSPFDHTKSQPFFRLYVNNV